MKLPEAVANSLRSSSMGGAQQKNTWQSVQAYVLERIRSGEWPAGGLIPTEQQLAVDLGCARATVNRALRELAEKGVVERRRKVGTRVSENQRRESVVQIPTLRREIEASGAVYGHQRLEIVDPAEPAPYISRAMLLAGGEHLIYCHSRFTADGAPYCCESRWINASVAPGLDCERLGETSATDFVNLNIAVTRGTLSICAAPADGKCADVLGVPHGSPLLVIERVLWDQSAAITLSRQHFLPDYRLTSEF